MKEERCRCWGGTKVEEKHPLCHSSNSDITSIVLSPCSPFSATWEGAGGWKVETSEGLGELTCHGHRVFTNWSNRGTYRFTVKYIYPEKEGSWQPTSWLCSLPAELRLAWLCPENLESGGWMWEDNDLISQGTRLTWRVSPWRQESHTQPGGAWNPPIPETSRGLEWGPSSVSCSLLPCSSRA